MKSDEVKEYFSSIEDIDLSLYPKLGDIFEVIYTNKNIEEKIFSIILDENTISDSASPKLNSIRRQTKKLEQDISSLEEKIKEHNDLLHQDEVLNDYQKYNEVVKELDDYNQELESLLETWETLQEEYES